MGSRDGKVGECITYCVAGPKLPVGQPFSEEEAMKKSPKKLRTLGTERSSR
jgi:hypothetical protein